VLIFERIKEELRAGKALQLAISEGFSRAWLAIRDGHFTALFSAIILFWVGTSVVEGFALIYAIGTLLSLFSGILVSRTLLVALSLSDKPFVRLLFGSGFSR
jgi:preprotein translocase subunit SecD